MKRKYVFLSMVSREKLTKEPHGHNILKLLYEKYPNLAPEYCNYHEPVNIPTPTFEDAYKLWNEEWFFCRRKHSVQMNISIMLNRFDVSSIRFECNWHKEIKWLNLFEELMKESKSYFGYIHFFTDREIESGEIGSAVDCFLRGTPSWALKENGIPQLAWANYFGEEYVKELDVSLLQQHGFEVNPLGDGYVFNVTNNIEDIITNYDHFNARRQELKSLFRPGLFQNYARYEHESKPIIL